MSSRNNAQTSNQLIQTLGQNAQQLKGSPMLAPYELLADGVIFYRIEIPEECARLLYANDAALSLFGCRDLKEMQDYCHDNYLNVFHPDDYRHHLTTILLSWKNEEHFIHHVQYRIITKNRETRIINDHGNVVHIPGFGKCCICVLTTMDRQITYSNDVSDQLTSLLGVGQFVQYSENLLSLMENETGRQFHIAYFNIRNFKNYNVEYGSPKGDLVLKTLAQILTKWSTTKVMTRINGDQFVAISRSEEMEERIQRVIDEFVLQYGRFGLFLDVGVYPITDSKQDIHRACDLAKIACDSVHDTMDHLAIYHEAMEKKWRISSYVVSHLNEALERGYLKLTYQPIMRTITGALCGIEAIVQWEDPTIGTLKFHEFMPALEEHHLSIRLDLWVLRQICEKLKQRERDGKRMFPIAFLLSHMDFMSEEFFEGAEALITRYSLPKDMIIFELEENLVLSNSKLSKDLLHRFKESGYQIWLDDFGRNYSVLKNLSRDYGFDAIRLDMDSLLPFDRHAKAILRVAVQLAKSLGVQTIAKNVTEEAQSRYLKEIGCEKMQGDYFGKADTLDVLSKSVFDQQTPVEYRADKRYYDQISAVDIITDHSLAITEFDQKNFKMLYVNASFLSEEMEIGFGRIDLLDYMINDPSSTLSRKFRYLQERTRLGKEYAEMDFSVFGKYFRLRSRRIAESDQRTANQVELINLSKGESGEAKSQQLDHIFRMMYSMYDVILLMRKDGLFENIMRSSLDKENDPKQLEQSGIIATLDQLLEYIDPDDRDEFKSFVDLKTVKERLLKTERGYLIRFYRSRYLKKSYIWKAHTLQYIPEMDIVIYSTRPLPLDQKSFWEKISPNHLESRQDQMRYMLGKTLHESSSIGLFWKDRNRKFVGANRKYLEMFGLEKESDLIGKYVEDFKWFVNDFSIKNDEENVLKNGVSLNNVIEKCIVNGETHTILVSKEPLYRNGEIIGLIGSGVDIDAFIGDELTNTNTKDWLTGLLASNGILNIVSEYVEGWNIRQEPFAVIRIEFMEHKQNYQEYRLDVANNIAKRVADTLRMVCKNRAIVARLYAGNYSILIKYTAFEAVTQLIADIQKTFSGIHQVDGAYVSFYPKFRVFRADEMEHVNELVAVATGGSEDDLLSRRQLEDKLKYYNVQLETVVDAIPGGIAMYEMVGDEAELVYASAGVGAVTGKTTEEFAAESHYTNSLNVHPQDLPLLHNATMQAVRDNSEINITYRLIHKDGSIIWVNMRGRVIGVQNGHPLLLIVYRNMSETSVIYESILDEALVGVFVSAAADGEILYVNRFAVSTSQSVTDGSIQKLYQLIVSMCTPDKEITNEPVPNNNRKYEIELRGRNLLVYFVDGSWNGREARICYVSDITAKYIEERAKATRESLLYLQAINTSYDLLVTFNLTQNQYRTEPGKNFLGYDWSNFPTYSALVEHVKQLLPDQGTDLLGYLAPEKQIVEYRNGISYSDDEHQVYDSDGVLHWVSDRIVYAKDPLSGDVMGISLTMLIDDRIRARNEQQEALRTALADAVEANQAKSQFLSNMSHDIRTPMNAVMGYAEIAVQHLDDKKRIQECLEKILASGNHLKELINDILDVSRIEAGKEELNLTNSSWDQVKFDVESVTVPLAEEKQIEFSIDLSGVCHHAIRLDLPKLRRIAVNIIGNSIKFTDPHGHISCVVKELEHTKKPGFGSYQITVSDDGIGIDQDYLEHIFETFSREQTSTESQIAGTGLGMAITKKYVELMGGQIHVDSKKGKGTTVTVCIDLEVLSTEQPAKAPKQETEKFDLTGKRILVVDDSSLNREIVSMMLEDYGVLTDTAVNGKDAVDRLNKALDGTYDCILMDMRMPVMDGVEATKRIRSSSRDYLKRVPILAISANAFQKDVKLCREAGMNDHISKPFTMEKLLEKLKQYHLPESY